MCQRQALIAAGLGVAASALLQTLLANATPRIVTELAAEPWYGFVAGSYFVVSTLALPVFSQYVDRVGARRVFGFGHLCLCVGTVGLALAPSMLILVLARAVQGLGAGAVAPASLAALGLLFDPETRRRALARIGMAQVIANAAGPPLGGWFSDGLGWRWGVLVVVPLSLTAVALTRSLPTRKAVSRWWRFRVQEQIQLWSDWTLARYGALAALIGVVSFGALTYAPLTLQQVHGLDATATGWMIAPMMIGLGIGASALGRLGRYPWARWAGWLPIGVGLCLALVNHSGVIATGLTLVGLGTGFVLPLALVDIQGVATAEQLGQAGGLVQFGRTAGAAAGIPALSLWLLCGLHLGVPAIFITLILVATAGLILNLVDRRPS